MTDNNIKLGILQMFWLMKQFCENTYKAKSELENYEFSPLKVGYEVIYEDKTYQLLLELKEV